LRKDIHISWGRGTQATILKHTAVKQYYTYYTFLRSFSTVKNFNTSDLLYSAKRIEATTVYCIVLQDTETPTARCSITSSSLQITTQIVFRPIYQIVN
jgi:hypothetical protein